MAVSFDAVIIGAGQAGPPLTARHELVKSRKDAIVRKSSEGVEKWMDGLKGEIQ